MIFRIAYSFTASLAKLSAQEQKAAKTTAFDLQVDPAHPGHKFHRIVRSQDPDFWSVRVNADIRLIVHRTADSFLLAYVDRHDDAYRWAERRRIETHPKTGAAQLVEIRERVEDIAPPPPAPPAESYPEPPRDSPAVARARQEDPEPYRPARFLKLSRDDILSVGVPEDWVDDIRMAGDDRFLELSEHLPAEAAEALFDYLTSGVLTLPPAAAAAFDHPDAQRRFRILADVDALERALTYPWEKWTVFLHPAQRRYAERPTTGPTRIAGAAGTGKSVVALHRAVHLARTNPAATALITTFSPILANALHLKLGRLVGDDPPVARRITVATVAEIGERLHAQYCGRSKPAGRVEIEQAIDAAMASVDGLTVSRDFVLAEWREVVDAWALRSWPAYRDVPRLGRKTRIGGRQREVLWAVFEKTLAALDRQGLVTTATTFARAAERLAATGDIPFTHIVVDEAQDVSVPELRFLAALGGRRPDGLFFTGDLGQRIFQQPFSWLALGVDIRGRSQVLRINYRTSHQIRSQADRLLPDAIADVDGVADSRRGAQSVFNGPPPVIALCASKADEGRRVMAWIEDRAEDGLAPGEIGVFVRSRDQIGRARDAIDAAGLSAAELMDSLNVDRDAVAVGTMHLAKGLEFRAVAVMACDDEIIPLHSRIAAVTDMADLDDVYATERRLLYVACTRARDHLLVTGVDPGSDFLDDLRAIPVTTESRESL